MSIYCVTTGETRTSNKGIFLLCKQNEKMNHISHNDIAKAFKISKKFAIIYSQWAMKILNVWILHQYRWNPYFKKGIFLSCQTEWKSESYFTQWHTKGF